MKKILLSLLLLLPLSGAAATPEGRVSPTRISAFITEFRHCEGVEAIQLGRLATGALRGILRFAARDDADARDVLKMMKGVRSLYVFEYEDCAPALRRRIDRRLQRILDDAELLMESSDEGDIMKVYGLYDTASDRVRDFIVYTPSDCTLVCMFGSFSMDTLAKMTADD